MTGIETVLADDPSMNVRDPALEDACQPLRAVLDSSFRFPADAAMLKTGASVHVFGLSDSTVPGALARSEATTHRVAAGPGGVDASAVLRALAELEVNDVLVEAGPGVNGALLAAGLVDEWLVYMAPKVMGDSGRGMFSIGELGDMRETIDLVVTETRQVGTDLRLRFRRKNVGE